MTLNFNAKEIAKEKYRFDGNPYVGYFSPRGNLFNFNTIFGEPGHDNWYNEASLAFISYISYILQNTYLDDFAPLYDEMRNRFLDRNRYLNRNEIVIRGISMLNLYDNAESFELFLNDLKQEILKYKQKINDPYCKMAYDILSLFLKCYKNATFFETLGIEIQALNKQDFIFQNRLNNFSMNEQDDFYINYLKMLIMSYFKDICVQYLGYDSIERFFPNGKSISISANDYNLYNYPRIITTSSSIPNERFYNYLLMDWKVHRIPKKVYNPSSEKFETESEFFQFYTTDKEEMLSEEIQSIKKLVPKDQRYKYFR